MYSIEIDGNHVLTRSFSDEVSAILNDFHNYSIDPNLYAFMCQRAPHESLAESEQYLSELLPSRSETGKLVFRLESSTNKCLGTVTAYDIDHKRKACSVGYAFGAAARGKGLAYKSISRVLDYANINFSIARFEAVTQVDNLPSIKVLSRLGFRIEGLHRNFYLGRQGNRVDAYSLGLHFK